MDTLGKSIYKKEGGLWHVDNKAGKAGSDQTRRAPSSLAEGEALSSGPRAARAGQACHLKTVPPGSSKKLSTSPVIHRKTAASYSVGLNRDSAALGAKRFLLHAGQRGPMCLKLLIQNQNFGHSGVLAQ